jgi:EmrB/QacA subfamily drug resistance transporter
MGMSKSVEYTWLVAVVVTFNSFMFYMDATIVNVALPTVGSLFHASTTTTGWIVTGYLLSLAMVIPASGWLGDRYGTKRIFLLGLTLFTAGSALCALAWNVEALVVFRIVQGVGAGVLSPVGSAMLYRAFPPEERARVAAFVVVPTVIAPTIGPIVGGYLVQYAGWSWIFLLNIPFGIVGIIMAAAVLKEQVQRSSGPFDVRGFVAGTVAVGALIYALQEAGRRGLHDPWVEVAVGAGMAALLLFVILELRGTYPMLNVKLFADRLFASGTATSFFVQMLFVGSIFLMPFLLQSEMGLSPFSSGLVAFPIAIGVGSAVPFASRWYRIIGPKRLLLLAMLLSIVSSASFIFVAQGTSDWLIRVMLLPRGWSFGFALVTLAAATYARIKPEQMGRATSLYAVGSQLGSSAGVAFIAAVLAARMAAHNSAPGNPATAPGAWAAFHETFGATVLLAIVGMGVALLVSDRLAEVSRGHIREQGRQQ